MRVQSTKIFRNQPKTNPEIKKQIPARPPAIKPYGSCVIAWSKLLQPEAEDERIVASE